MTEKIKNIFYIIMMIIISYLFFYNITSEFVVRFFQGSSNVMNILLLLLLVIQTIIIYITFTLFKHKSISKSLYYALIVLYLIILIIVLFGRRNLNTSINFNLLKLFEMNIDNIIQTLLNLLIFIPFGYFLKSLTFKNVLIISIIAIILIETIQLIFQLGIFDINDILLNVFSICFTWSIVTKNNFEIEDYINK